MLFTKKTTVVTSDTATTPAPQNPALVNQTAPARQTAVYEQGRRDARADVNERSLAQAQDNTPCRQAY